MRAQIAYPAILTAFVLGSALMATAQTGEFPVCTENLIRVDDAMESPKLVE